MPRSDGTLYEFEKAKLKKQAEREAEAVKPKPAPKLVVLPDPPKPKGRKPHPLAPNPIARNGKPARVAITPELIETILNNIQGGMPVEPSCILAGITRDGVDKWLKKNPALRHRFMVAELEWEKTIVGNIQSAAKADHRAGQWLLERRVSSRWAPVSKQELTGKNGGPLQQMTLAKELLGGLANKGDPAEAAKRPAQSIGKTA
jgi:hypothetical protein